MDIDRIAFDCYFDLCFSHLAILPVLSQLHLKNVMPCAHVVNLCETSSLFNYSLFVLP